MLWGLGRSKLDHEDLAEAAREDWWGYGAPQAYEEFVRELEGKGLVSDDGRCFALTEAGRRRERHLFGEAAPRLAAPRMSSAQAVRWAESVADRLGKGLDAGVLETVAGLHRRGIATTASCEGHLDRGLPYPWIDFSPEAARQARRLVMDPLLAGFELRDGGEHGELRLQPRGLDHAPSERPPADPERLRRWQETMRSLGRKLLAG